MRRVRVFEPPSAYRDAMTYLLTQPAVVAVLDRMVPYAGPEVWSHPAPGTDVREPWIISHRNRWWTRRPPRIVVELHWPNVSAAFRLDETGEVLVLDRLDVEDDDLVREDGMIEVTF